MDLGCDTLHWFGRHANHWHNDDPPRTYQSVSWGVTVGAEIKFY